MPFLFGKSIMHENYIDSEFSPFLSCLPSFLHQCPSFSFLCLEKKNSKYRKKYSFPMFFFLLLWWDLQTSVELKFTPLPIWQISILAFFSLKTNKQTNFILKKSTVQLKIKEVDLTNFNAEISRYHLESRFFE